jgi:hypothetical protein
MVSIAIEDVCPSPGLPESGPLLGMAQGLCREEAVGLG